MQGPMMPPGHGGQSGYNSPYNAPHTPGYPPPAYAPSQDEKLLSCLSHASIIIPHAGLLAPLIIWLLHRDANPSGKGAYAAYHGKQAFLFHLALVLLEYVLGFGLFVLGFLTFGLVWILLPLVGLVHLIASIYGIVGAVKTLGGGDFHYPFIGGWMKNL